jgi:thiamine-phosphate pyrophosphorylase
LYAIADVGILSARNIDVLAFSKAVLLARPAALQLRAKDVPAREILALLRALHPMCRQLHVPLVANDRADVAALAGCDLVHIGQTDMAIEMVRRLAPGIGVGISTHNASQLACALEHRPAYVAFGPVYPTESKVDPDPVVGVAALRAAHAQAIAAGVPLVAIGGITLENAIDVAAAADACAVIGALVPPAGTIDFDAITHRARLLHEALLGGGEQRIQAGG